MHIRTETFCKSPTEGTPAFDPTLTPRVVAVGGSVIDIAVPASPLLAIRDTVEIAWERSDRLLAEVQVQP